MHSIQKLRWKDVLNDVLYPSELEFEWIKLEFANSNPINNRDGLYVKGEFGIAEVSPLPGYFDRDIECFISAIDTVSKPWPKPKRESVDVNALVSSSDDIKDELLEFETIKVKVHSQEDIELAKTVREFVGSGPKIRIDCNGKFDIDQAQNLVRMLRDVDLELIEQPCETNKENAKLRKKIDIPLAIDETARTHSEIFNVKKLEAADIIVVKVQPGGGLHRAIDLVDHWSGDVIVSHMMESQVGIDVGVSLAKALDELNFACGLRAPELKKILREPLDT